MYIWTPIKIWDETRWLTNLENISGNPDHDTIIIGDLNADGTYYDENPVNHFTGWHWIINNNMDTSVATSNNTYDRIILNNNTLNNYLFADVMDDVTEDQSDHYLVYALFNPNYQ